MNTCPNHPVGRTCPSCQRSFSGWDAAQTLIQWAAILGFGLIAWVFCMACPILLIIPAVILLLYGIIKAAIVAAGRELRKP